MRAVMLSMMAVAVWSSTVAPAALASPSGSSEAAYAATTQQLQEVQGMYALPNGAVLRLREIDDRLYASLNDRDVREVRMTGENTYASRDGAITVVFKPGTADLVTVNYDKNSTFAAQYAPSVRERGSLWRSPNGSTLP